MNRLYWILWILTMFDGVMALLNIEAHKPGTVVCCLFLMFSGIMSMSFINYEIEDQEAKDENSSNRKPKV